MIYMVYNLRLNAKRRRVQRIQLLQYPLHYLYFRKNVKNNLISALAWFGVFTLQKNAQSLVFFNLCLSLFELVPFLRNSCYTCAFCDSTMPDCMKIMVLKVSNANTDNIKTRSIWRKKNFDLMCSFDYFSTYKNQRQI